MSIVYEEIDKPRYFLKAEKQNGRKKEGQYIEITRINEASNYRSDDLFSLDHFTSKYTMKELIELLKSSNLILNEYDRLPLKIESIRKGRKKDLTVLTKDNLYNIYEFSNGKYLLDSHTKDILRGKYNAIIENLNKDDYYKKYIISEFSTRLNIDDYKAINEMLCSLPYYSQTRTLYFVISNAIENLKLEQLTSKRTLEKGNEIL